MNEPKQPAQEPSSSGPGVLRRTYEWVLKWAESRYALPALFVLALAEASFFPIPPDVLLLAMAMGRPRMSLRFAFWCTLGSVAGGLIGYLIGALLWSGLQDLVFEHVFPAEKFEFVLEQYRAHGFWVIFTAAFTPVPFKVFTVAAGVARLDLVPFVIASLVGRGARFFLVAGIVRIRGERAREFFDRYFNLITVAVMVLLVGGAAASTLRH